MRKSGFTDEQIIVMIRPGLDTSAVYRSPLPGFKIQKVRRVVY